MTREERLAKKAAYTGMVYAVPRADVGRPCDSCGATIHWVRTVKGKWMPVEYDGIPHFAFCPDADKFSKRGKS